MLVRLLLCLATVFVRQTKQLTRGRDAKAGDFPFVVRILISEELPDDHQQIGKIVIKGLEPEERIMEYQLDQYTLKVMHSYGDKTVANSSSNVTRIDHDNDDINMHRHTQDHGGSVSAGVLITTSRVLTTCDGVGFFTGQTVNLYSLDKVSIMAGSVKNTGEGGQFRVPSRSNVHPFCYFMTTMSTVLFNYGVYELDEPFDRIVMNGTNIPLIAPVKNSFKSMDDMQVLLQTMRKGKTKIECFAVGWGNRKREFEGRGMPDYFQRFSSTLQMTSMRLVDYPECYESTCEFFDECLLSIWESGYVCAKAPEGGPCNEDNGAPLICNGEVFGMFIDPKRCTNTGHPRLFLRIDLAFNFVFDIKNRSNLNAVASYTVLNALIIPLLFHICSVYHSDTYQLHL